MVHFCGGDMSRVHWTACKAVLAFYAGSSSVTKLIGKVLGGRSGCARIVAEVDHGTFKNEVKVTDVDNDDLPPGIVV